MKVENKEKIKNYFKKVMFERINGVDIEKLSTSELLRQVKLLPILFIIMIVCSVVILVMSIMFIFLITDDFGDMWYIPLIVFAMSLSSAFLAYIFPKRLKNVKETLDTREISEEMKNKAKEKINETKKYAVMGAIVWIVAMVVFGVVFASGAFEPGDWCKKCGQEAKLVEGYSLCLDCYEDYFEEIESIYED